MSSEFVISEYDSGFSDTTPDSIANGFSEENVCGSSLSCVVYQMRLNGLRVAVKRLRADYVSNPTFTVAYRKEFLIGRMLKHDGLPLYRQFRSDINEVYIVMDFIDGITLDEFINTRDGQEYFRSVENVRMFLDRLLDVTTYLHRAGVIHCDLKPANIMLRHTDRCVMLIDLDKAFTDTLDLTHGGTKENSAPMEAGQIPTVYKDFAAIGMIVDLLASSVSAFPKSSFRRFRKECASASANSEILKEKLKPRRDLNTSIALAAIASLSIAIVSVLILYTRDEKHLPIDSPIPTVDTVMQKHVDDNAIRSSEVEINRAPETETIGTPQPFKREVNKDFVITPEVIDARFRPLIHEIEDSYRRIRSGKISTSGITDMLQRIGAAYQTEYGKLCKEYGTETDIDATNALLRAYQKTRISQLYMPFLQECGDSVDARLSKGLY